MVNLIASYGSSRYNNLLKRFYLHISLSIFNAVSDVKSNESDYGKWQVSDKFKSKSLWGLRKWQQVSDKFKSNSHALISTMGAAVLAAIEKGDNRGHR